MTIRRQWLLVLLMTVLLSVLINSIILTTLINKYFIGYSTEKYNTNISQLVTFSGEILSDPLYSPHQLKLQLETHLNDPISRIRIYNSTGNLIAEVSSNSHHMMKMRGNKMAKHMMANFSEEDDLIDIFKDNTPIGQLVITKYSSIGNSIESKGFMVSLIGYSILSFFLIFIFIFIIGIFISKKMSKDLKETALQTIEIDLGTSKILKKSHVKEIRIIQQGLETLQNRLKLKQVSRKKLVDELVHQTRTPLTILKTHLEGFEDGIIHFTPEEIKTCENQIDNISSIINNMSSLIDSDKEIDPISIEKVEINSLIKEIIGGLKLQFEKKSVDLALLSQEKLFLRTDPYKLRQIIYNILTNAYKYTNPMGRVTVNYLQEENELKIIIQDTGSGLSEEEKNKIFDAYYRGPNSQGIEGEGLGLYIVVENLNKINGRIDVHSSLGEGSKFIINLPILLDY